MSTVLYRKYRPASFEEITGQEHVVRTLMGALLSGRVGHAYLFTGPRGVGKTTMARLLAKSLNCEKKKSAEPCNNCFSCTAVNEGTSLDIIEIDGASNRGIDEIRNLKESAQVAASTGRHKIFIIDEVHMLTPPAFSALLKILEEPPAHVVFILATTDAHKIPATILSRVQRFDYKKLTPIQIADKLTKIAGLEKIKLDSKAALAIARSAEGGMRDAESSLTKIMAYGNEAITHEHVSQILGIVPNEVHFSFLQHLVSNNAQGSLAMITAMYDDGVNLVVFCKQFVAYARLALLYAFNTQGALTANLLADEESTPLRKLLQKTDPEQIIKIVTAFSQAQNDLKHSPVPQLPLELAVIGLSK